MEQPIRAWHIGEHGEIFAGRCDEEGIKQYLRELCGEKDGNEQIASLCEEISQSAMDTERDWNDGDGNNTRTTLRREAEQSSGLPIQISTTYN